jgi:hypothetical protein
MKALRLFFVFMGVCLASGLISSSLSAQDDDTLPDYYNSSYLRYEDYVYRPNIKSVQLAKEGFDLTYPVIELNSEERLVLGFDDMADESKTYSYTIIHCGADWQPSNILSNDYIEGFAENQIRDFDFSFNTFFKFVHYSLTIPNGDMKPMISGNYILKVWQDFNQDSLVLTRRFSVVEQIFKIDATAKQAIRADLRKTHHEIDFTLTQESFNLTDPFTQVKVVLTQNYRWDNAITNLQPQYIKDKELLYDYDEENTFPAGSEFRHFDTKSMKFRADRIKTIEYVKPYFHVQLTDDEARPFKIYFTDQDINGRYFVKNDDGKNSDTDADYVYVYFNLPYPAPIIDGDLYVFGALSDWNYTAENRMIYNYDKKAYQLKMLLKQGYYNYEYIYLKNGSKTGDVTLVEGSHFETENDYLIFVYYRDIHSRYDRLAGFNIVNTINKK